METKKMQILYILQNGNSNEYKIGITDNLNRRLAQLQTGCPNELKIIKIWTHYQRKTILKYERVLHRFYTKCGCRIRPNGEWFNLRVPDINFLCKPNSIAEQNEVIENILKMM
jgi:predicted GIY-YIG superfamily endonuclease